MMSLLVGLPAAARPRQGAKSPQKAGISPTSDSLVAAAWRANWHRRMAADGFHTVFLLQHRFKNGHRRRYGKQPP